jgi:pantothenate kinase
MTERLIRQIRERATGPDRFIVGLAGPPASGKSSMAWTIAKALAPGVRVVPMDGFHYDDAVLEARGLRARKGSPASFDAAGFVHLVRRLRTEDEVAIPIFDRGMELSRAAADVVTAADRIVIVEGNYLLLDTDPWRDLAPLFDMTVFLDVPEAELIRRLTARWKHHGRDDQAARDWIASNDLPNALTVIRNSRPADVVLRTP